MRCQLPENILVTLLRQSYRSPSCEAPARCLSRQACRNASTIKSPTRRRERQTMEPGQLSKSIQTFELGDHYSSTVLAQSSRSTDRNQHTPPQDIAILGGGITGLASAYYLTQLTKANITLYESTERLGGWLRTKHIDVGNGTVVFEEGPRTLRPNTPAGLVTLELIKDIGLEDEVLVTPSNSIAAQNRFVYYPDHLVRMPGLGQKALQMLWQFLGEPVFKGVLTGLLAEHLGPRRPLSLEDESVGSFLQRRLGNTDVADNIVSAILHGIYAGDVYQLSTKSLLPDLWHNEGEYGSITAGLRKRLMTKATLVRLRDHLLMEELTKRNSSIAWFSEMKVASVYSFKKGIGALSDALVAALRANPKVRIKTSHEIKKVLFDSESNSVEISTTQKQPATKFDQVISTISGRALSCAMDKMGDLPSLQSTHAVTVMVVNFYYANPSILPAHGFGYLIPRSVPWNQNPERALGVVFDSDAAPSQDTALGTKITIMLGGHWWDDFSSYPDEAEGVAMAKAILKRHLKIEEEPMVVNVGLQRECIPQYTVGHEERMKKAHHDLMRVFKGKLAVAGNSYTGVGLNDCVRAARDVARHVVRLPGTGLEQFLSDPWVEMTLVQRPKS